MAENEKGLINNQEGQFVEQSNKPKEMVDLQENLKPFASRELKTWMEIVEQDPDLTSQSQQIGDDDSVLQPIAPAVVKITLPTTKKTFASGFNKTFSEAGRWLSEFVFRLIKKEKGNVKFNEE